MFRNFLRRTGFRRQLTVIISAAILGLALFSSLMNSWEASRRMHDYFVKQGVRIAENLARQSTLALLFHSSDNAREGVDTTLSFPDVIQVEITGTTHKPLLNRAKQGANLAQMPKQFETQTLSTATTEFENDEIWRFGAPVYEGQAESSPFEVQERQPQLLGYVHVVISKSTLNRLTLSLLLTNLGITLFFAVLLLAVVRFLTRHAINPLNALSDLMRRAERGESGMRAEPLGPRDLIEMALAFNKMMNVLEEREEELKQSRDKAVNMALMKAQFAATVSHEVRTPLNGVVGMLDMLKEMNLNKRQQECVEVAWSSSRTLIDLINNILDFSKMEAGKLELEEIDFDLRKLMEEVIELIAKQAQQKGLELGYLLHPDVPERVKGDSLRLRQILINLIGNAVKFTEKGEVAIRIASFKGEDGNSFLRFEVSDTGIGMNQDAVQHVFESFAQADPSTTRKYGGTGLGLAICKQLVGLLGGEIGVASQVGKGTTFFFSIRYKPGDTNLIPAEDLALKGIRVLVVDESEIVRSFLEQNLTRHHMQCHAVRNGIEAVSELRRAKQDMHQYGLIIMDIGAVDENGIDLTRRIHADYPASNLRILVLDRYNTPSTVAAPGVDATLGKPLRLDRLLDAIKQLLTVQEVSENAPSERSGSAPTGTVLNKEFRILVAEDNRTNQMVAAGMLAMNGCKCEFAANGREAMEAARNNRFDLILMDCSMPEMDGYEATAHIRNYEESAGHRTPIVAMTANTQRGDAEKCLAAGMDDYLAKPITLVELRQKLELWLPRGVPDERSSSINTNNDRTSQALEASDASALDHVIFDKLREILGPSLEQAVKPFLEDTPEYLDQLELAVKDGNADKARASAHAIKGSSGNLGAVNLAQIAKQAEEMSLDGQVAEIASLLPHMRIAFDAVARALNAEVSIDDLLVPQQGEELAQVLVVDDDRSTRSALYYEVLKLLFLLYLSYIECIHSNST
ncbi:MAG: response regulator, partial [Burkholderiales bacterium]|nr:response regulator [Burkholderiales bacterium]